MRTQTLFDLAGAEDDITLQHSIVLPLHTRFEKVMVPLLFPAQEVQVGVQIVISRGFSTVT